MKLLKDYVPESNIHKNIWLKTGGSFRCGNCLYMPTFVDIRDWKTCPKCGKEKLWYETNDGFEPVYREGESDIIIFEDAPKKEVEIDDEEETEGPVTGTYEYFTERGTGE